MGSFSNCLDSLEAPLDFILTLQQVFYGETFTSVRQEEDQSFGPNVGEFTYLRQPSDILCRFIIFFL
jgi:hypothetical protein